MQHFFNRTRYVLIIIIVASILAFISVWNSVQFSWINLRLEKASYALKYRAWDIKNKDSLKTPEERERYDDVRLFLSARELTDSASIGKLKDALYNLQINEIIHIRVPFFGIVFDINDLSLLGGFTFVVLLLWYRFSLLRERNNLNDTLDIADLMGDGAVCFDLLSMQQVLTIPFNASDDKYKPEQSDARFYELIGRLDYNNGLRFINRVPKLLHWLPVFIYTFAIVYDMFTSKYGLSISGWRTYSSYGVSLLLLFIIFQLTVKCTKHFIELDLVWEKHAKPKQKKLNAE